MLALTIPSLCQIPFTAIQFPLYEALKVQMSKRLLADGRKPAAHEAALCGMLAGGVAAACTTPLDVVKTRAMLEVKVRGMRCFVRPGIELIGN